MKYDLSDYICSTPRVLLVQTDEEERLVQKFHDLKPEGGRVDVWNASMGVVESGEYIDEWRNIEHPENTNEMRLNSVLPNIYKTPGVMPEGNADTGIDPLYFIILDADEQLGNSMVRRWIKNIAISGYKHPDVNRTIVLQSNSGRVHPTLRPYVETHTLSLPDQTVIRSVIRKVEKEVRDFEVEHVIYRESQEAQAANRRFDESDRRRIERNYTSDFTIPSDRDGEEIPHNFLAACAGLTLFQVKELFYRLWVTKGEITADDVFDYRHGVTSNDDIIEFVDTELTFDDVAGLDRQKDWLEEVGACFTEKGREWGLKPPKGLLQVGVPGCGKSLTAKAVANEWDLPLVRLDPGRLFSGQVGSSERNMRRALSLIEACTPCVVWIDEIEKGFSGTESSNFSDGGTTSRVIGTFLTWFEEHREEAFLIATSNDITQIPTEMVGRFDETFFVYLPGPEARMECFRIHLENEWSDAMGDLDDLDLVKLSEFTQFFTGREIVQVVKEGIRRGFRTPDRKVTTDCFMDVIECKPPLVRTMDEEMNALLTWVGYDEKREEGVRARFASTERPEDPMKGRPELIDATNSIASGMFSVSDDEQKVN